MIDIDVGMDLQLFAEEKTEKATPKRRRDAREKGQVLKSMEINSVLVLLAVFGAIDFMFSDLLEACENVYKAFLKFDLPLDFLFTYNELRNLWIQITLMFFKLIGPVLAISMIAGLVANYGQVGFLITNETLIPKLSRLNPIEGFKRIFSKRAIFELFKSLTKIGIVAWVVWSELSTSIFQIHTLFNHDIKKAVQLIADKSFTIVYKAGLALVILAILDYFYQWWEYEKSLRMSKQEIKEEYKQMEGDPQIRSKIRERQRQLGMRRMIQEIPHADVVITNPTHYAVALRYRQDEDDAPVVIAKGKDYLALKIKEVAKEHDVVTVENKPLAQALYNTTEIGSTIPPELFHAVAEVLAFVYNLKRTSL